MGTVIVRMDPTLKEKAVKLARAEGKTLSAVIRELLEGYIRERDIGLYIDDLWDRLGEKLQRQGIATEAINRAIDEIRQETP